MPEQSEPSEKINLDDSGAPERTFSTYDFKRSIMNSVYDILITRSAAEQLINEVQIFIITLNVAC